MEAFFLQIFGPCCNGRARGQDDQLRVPAVGSTSNKNIYSKTALFDSDRLRAPSKGGDGEGTKRPQDQFRPASTSTVRPRLFSNGDDGHDGVPSNQQGPQGAYQKPPSVHVTGFDLPSDPSSPATHSSTTFLPNNRGNNNNGGSYDTVFSSSMTAGLSGSVWRVSNLTSDPPSSPPHFNSTSSTRPPSINPSLRTGIGTGTGTGTGIGHHHHVHAGPPHNSVSLLSLELRHQQESRGEGGKPGSMTFANSRSQNPGAVVVEGSGGHSNGDGGGGRATLETGLSSRSARGRGAQGGQLREGSTEANAARQQAAAEAGHDLMHPPDRSSSGGVSDDNGRGGGVRTTGRVGPAQIQYESFEGPSQILPDDVLAALVKKSLPHAVGSFPLLPLHLPPVHPLLRLEGNSESPSIVGNP